MLIGRTASREALLKLEQGDSWPSVAARIAGLSEEQVPALLGQLLGPAPQRPHPSDTHQVLKASAKNPAPPVQGALGVAGPMATHAPCVPRAPQRKGRGRGRSSSCGTTTCSITTCFVTPVGNGGTSPPSLTPPEPPAAAAEVATFGDLAEAAEALQLMARQVAELLRDTSIEEVVAPGAKWRRMGQEARRRRTAGGLRARAVGLLQAVERCRRQAESFQAYC